MGEGPLLERAKEIAALRAAMDAARAGSGCLAMVQGPPGAGKTSLLTAAVDCARAAGLRVLEARGRELEREIALGVALELLTPPVTATAPGERARLVHGMAAPAAPLFPGLLPGAHSAVRLDADVLLHGMCWLAANLTGWDRADATLPMLVAVDDAQWADEASLRFLTMLADRVGKLPIAMVVAARDGGAESDVPALRTLASRPPHRLLTPAPLSSAAVDRLVGDAFPDGGDGLAAAVAHASGGNPFLVGELLRSLQADGGVPAADAVAGIVPDTVLRSVLARLARLPADAGRLAASAAVLGDGTPLRRAAAHAGLEPAPAERAADVLATAHLLRPGDPLAFVHPLIASAIHADLPAFARARAHHRAADLLAADGEGVEKIAGHLLATHPEGDSAVARVLREAAGRAVRRGDPAAAVRLLHRALPDEMSGERRGELLVELARAQLVAGDIGALASVTEGLALLGEASAPGKVRALNLLTQVRHARDDFAGAAVAHHEALALLEPGSAKWQNALAGYLMVSTFHPPLRRDGERLLAPVLAETRRGRPPDRPGLLAHVTLRLALAGAPPADVRRTAALALARDPLVGPEGHGGLLGIVVHSLVIAGELTAAETAADAALSAAGRRGDVIAYAGASYHRALARYHLGALTPALADLEAARMPYGEGWISAGGWIGSLLARLRLEQGDAAGAEQALHLADKRPADGMDLALVLDSQARISLLRGEPATALDTARAAGRHLEEIYEIDHPGLLPWRATAALAAHHLGDHRTAVLLAGQEAERARAVGVPQAVGAALRVAGLVARPGPDLGLLAEACHTLQETPAVLEHARALVDLGAALRRAGRRNECRQPLRQGLELADRMHARLLAERARTELHAAGVRPRRAAVTGIDALTPAERRVALLALHGHSNSQIAQALFVTIKTVETHLARAYRKLAITNRRQLREAFGPVPQA
ncbi:regulatory protein, luxR family [Nonomuraea solani]|uniref:Regulatory protein, luxR family n=1 Tax=Nonomuraea solani TaxID=1144553 RepID=A0A1H6BSN1_9ACTN|nr:regulatory protein, luxR family [Nonomuraea solani]